MIKSICNCIDSEKDNSNSEDIAQSSAVVHVLLKVLAQRIVGTYM